jgi:hypothetical protein
VPTKALLNRVVDWLGGQLEGGMAERAGRYRFPFPVQPGTFE